MDIVKKIENDLEVIMISIPEDTFLSESGTGTSVRKEFPSYT